MDELNNLNENVLTFENEFDNFINDPFLPNLLPEEPMPNESLPIDDLLMMMPQLELTDLCRKLDSLAIDANTHGLRIEIERSKRQRLQTTIKQLRRNLSIANDEIAFLKNEIAQLRDQQNSINFQLSNESVRTNTLAFRSLSRISQILAFGPHNFLSFENPELEILLQELDSTIRLFGVYYAASYV